MIRRTTASSCEVVRHRNQTAHFSTTIFSPNRQTVKNFSWSTSFGPKDLAPLAVEKAKQRAQVTGVKAQFAVADVLQLPDLGEPFGFFFDRGCYHAVRRSAPHQYAPAVAHRLTPGARGLILAGNAREPHDPGPPVVSEEQIRDELGVVFHILDLHEFRFEEAPGVPVRFLGWSCMVEKR